MDYCIEDFKLVYENRTYPVKVPFSLYDTLLTSGEIPNPYYGENERLAYRLCEKGMYAEAQFCLPAELSGKRHVNLTFYGLDTLCRIVLNGTELGFTQDMHLFYTYDVKSLLLDNNRLELTFSSPLQYVSEQQAQRRITGGCRIEGIAHLRKANYMFGWDWGAFLPDMGVWKPVTIAAYDNLCFSAPVFRQTHEKNSVLLEVACQKNHASDSFRTCLYSPQGELLDCADGENASFTVRNPQLWWCNGYGGQPLYTVTVTVTNGTEQLQKSYEIGLRTFTVCNEQDEHGKEFAFCLNGKKIFSMGANYIPQDHILNRITATSTEKLLLDMKQCNFNAVRVWGGGFYPNDCFYALCDRFGLLVWQDFMLACCPIDPADDSFYRDMDLEAEQNLTRIRHHACLALFCGNNEIEQLLRDWDVYKTEEQKQIYLTYFETRLPEVVRRVVPELFYMPSSPTGGGSFLHTNDTMYGDCHYWDVWHNNLPVESYCQPLRFCSEYGFQSFPSVKTIEAFSDSEDRNIFSPVMELHQKNGSANVKIVQYASARYRYADGFEKFVYLSQISQSDAIKCAVEYWRSHRGVCMGSLYWQVNDSWPVASWSSIDYYGRWKALQYAAKRFYAPVLLTVLNAGSCAEVYVCNETLYDFDGSVMLAMCEDGVEPCVRRIRAFIPAQTSALLVQYDNPAGNERRRYLSAILNDTDDGTVSCRAHLFCPPKYFSYRNFQPETDVTENDEYFTIKLRFPYLAQNVCITTKYDVHFSDNYLDFTPLCPEHTILCQKPAGCTADTFLNSLHFITSALK